MGGHHLVMGEIRDILTGSPLEDTHDNRYRQKIAGLLLQAGFDRKTIRSDIPLILHCESRRAGIRLDFLVHIKEKPALLVRYGPGSLITRHTPARAAALLMTSPLVMVTNGEDAHLLDTRSGRMLAEGLDSIPDPDHLEKIFLENPLPLTQYPDPALTERCHRILFAFEVHDACPCDDAVCHLPPET